MRWRCSILDLIDLNESKAKFKPSFKFLQFDYRRLRKTTIRKKSTVLVLARQLFDVLFIGSEIRESFFAEYRPLHVLNGNSLPSLYKYQKLTTNFISQKTFGPRQSLV